MVGIALAGGGRAGARDRGSRTTRRAAGARGDGAHAGGDRADRGRTGRAGLVGPRGGRGGGFAGKGPPPVRTDAPYPRARSAGRAGAPGRSPFSHPAPMRGTPETGSHGLPPMLRADPWTRANRTGECCEPPTEARCCRSRSSDRCRCGWPRGTTRRLDPEPVETPSLLYPNRNTLAAAIVRRRWNAFACPRCPFMPARLARTVATSALPAAADRRKARIRRSCRTFTGDATSA